jgi:hypothetical protein
MCALQGVAGLGPRRPRRASRFRRQRLMACMAETPKGDTITIEQGTRRVPVAKR